MKESEFDITRDCGKCKEPLFNHPQELDGGIRLFGSECTRPEKEFDSE